MNALRRLVKRRKQRTTEHGPTKPYDCNGRVLGCYDWVVIQADPKSEERGFSMVGLDAQITEVHDNGTVTLTAGRLEGYLWNSKDLQFECSDLPF